MTCSVCGDACSCFPAVAVRSGYEPSPGSEAERGDSRCHANELPPLATEPSRQQPPQTAHAIVLEDPRPKFVVDTAEPPGVSESGPAYDAATMIQEQTEAPRFSSRLRQEPLLAEPCDSSWRDEVTARLHRYQARRRPRGPRYPSLRLKFENPEPSTTSSRWNSDDFAAAATTQSPLGQVTASRQSVAMDCAPVMAEPVTVQPPPKSERTPQPAVVHRESPGKIIQFPRPEYEPPMVFNDLADPIFDRPRILEAPEVVPPPPALGGITIEELAKAEPERRPGIDMPLQPAPLEQRVAAMAIDALLVLLSVVTFGAIYYQLTHIRPPLFQSISLGAGLLGVFWAAYQYLLIVYCGTSPGLRAMKLQLRRFDGSVAKRSVRRWRVLCSWLSAASLGMGYLWQFLDEDALCWHERVTKTYLSRSSNT